MGSSSSGFFLRPLLMNLASSAGVIPLCGIVVFGVCSKGLPEDGVVVCGALPQQWQGAPIMMCVPLWVCSTTDERQWAAPPKQGLSQ